MLCLKNETVGYAPICRYSYVTVLQTMWKSCLILLEGWPFKEILKGVKVETFEGGRYGVSIPSTERV